MISTREGNVVCTERTVSTGGRFTEGQTDELKTRVKEVTTDHKEERRIEQDFIQPKLDVASRQRVDKDEGIAGIERNLIFLGLPEKSAYKGKFQHKDEVGEPQQ